MQSPWPRAARLLPGAQPRRSPGLILKTFMNWLRSISLSLARVIYDTATCGRATDSRLPTGQLNPPVVGGGVWKWGARLEPESNGF